MLFEGGGVVSAVWMRLRSELRIRWRAWLGLAVLIGLAGSAAAAAAAGARRTIAIPAALVVANLIAAAPGQAAARTPIATVLGAE